MEVNGKTLSGNALLDEVDHPNLKAMVDTVAMSVSGETLDQWFDCLGSDIRNMHFVDCNRDYLEILPDVAEEWKRIRQEYKVPYYPHVTVGWDNNPRHHFLTLPIIRNNTPENFKKGEPCLLDPASADFRNVHNLERYFEDE